MPRVAIPNLYTALRKLLDQIPRGRVATYGDLATALGSISAARWVGEFMAHHEHDSKCNCHRVLRKTGETGLYVTGNVHEKTERLKGEGISVNDGVVDVDHFRFSDFTSRMPLRRLLRFQEEIRGQLKLSGYRRKPQYVAGVDLSYEKKSPGAPSHAYATYAVVDSKKLRLVNSVTIRRRVRFPYIPGFLTFREAPILMDLLEKVAASESLAEVVLVDGNGILHPRRAGVATFLGVQADVRTIGVGKSLLCGTIEDDGSAADTAKPIRLDGKCVGHSIGNTSESRPVFVSPGHKITVPSSLRVVREMFDDHRVPEPIFHADRISREAVKAGK